MWAHLAARSMLRAPSTMLAKSPATARMGTGIYWHSYFHETGRLHPSVRSTAPQLARHLGLTIVGQWLAIAKVATRIIARCCFPTALFKISALAAQTNQMPLRLLMQSTTLVRSSAGTAPATMHSTPL